MNKIIIISLFGFLFISSAFANPSNNLTLAYWDGAHYGYHYRPIRFHGWCFYHPNRCHPYLHRWHYRHYYHYWHRWHYHHYWHRWHYHHWR